MNWLHIACAVLMSCVFSYQYCRLTTHYLATSAPLECEDYATIMAVIYGLGGVHEPYEGWLSGVTIVIHNYKE